MSVSKVNNHTHTNTIGKQVLKSAGVGAALTGGLIAVPQAYYWTANRDLMIQTVKENGGKVPYIKSLLAGTMYLMGLSALLSGLVSFVSEKIHAAKADKQ